MTARFGSRPIVHALSLIVRPPILPCNHDYADPAISVRGTTLQLDTLPENRGERLRQVHTAKH